MDKAGRMGKFLKNDEDELGFDPTLMLHYNYDDGLFSIIYDCDSKLSKQKIIEIFKLIDMVYTNASFLEDWYIKAKAKIHLQEYIGYYYVHRPCKVNDVAISIPVYIQSLEGKLFKRLTKTVGIEFICDESEETPIYGVRVHPYVYFDYTTLACSGRVIDQRKAAKKNRQILYSFLRALEKVLNANPLEITSAHPYFEEFIYEHGVRDGAECLL
jgi:hypothetical protein